MKKFKVLLIFLALLLFIDADARVVSLEREWNLVGVFADINDTSKLVENVDVIWGYKDSKWYADSNKTTIKRHLDELNISKLKNIVSGDAFWIYTKDAKDINIDENSSVLNKLTIHKGWQLLSTNITLDISQLKHPSIKSVWLYRDNRFLAWSPDKVINGKLYEHFSSIQTINSGEGFWIEAYNDDVINFQNPLSSVDFPSSYYPTKEHPRLWLSDERMQEFNLSISKNTQSWREFRDMCDSIIDADSTNDPWDLSASPQNYTAPLALAYLLTKNTKYADKAIELVDATSTDLSAYGDPDHQSFYFLGLTYDWLYNYVKMTPSKKDSFYKKMKELSDKFYSDLDLTASGTDSDANLLTANLHLVYGISLYGDYNESITFLNRAWKGWSDGYYTQKGTSNRDMIKEALGGVYFTGMAYFPSTDIIGISGFELSLKSGCDYDINIQESELKPFWANTIYATIALTEPSRKYIYDYGSWQDPNLLQNQPWLKRAMSIASYFCVQAQDKTSQALANGYMDAVNIGEMNDYFLGFFYSYANPPTVSLYEQNLPLIHFAKSPDFLLFRDSWDKNASWGVFRGDGSIPLDQQAMDQGHFSLWYGDGYLTKGARNYEALSHGDFFNTLSIENSCTLNGTSCSGTAIFDSKGKAQITRYKISNTTPLFAYSMLDADDQWDDLTTDNIKTYRRHFFWTPNYVVVFDRVRTNKTLDIKYRLRALQEPSIDGLVVSQLSQNKKYKLLQKTLSPDGVSIKKVDESVLWSGLDDWVVNTSERHWQSVIDINDTTSTNILNVIEMGDATLKDFTNLQSLKSSSNDGVHIGKWSVVFANDEILRDLVEYNISNASDDEYHLIADIKNGDYQVYLNSTPYVQMTISNDDNNTMLFHTTTSSSELNIKIEKR